MTEPRVFGIAYTEGDGRMIARAETFPTQAAANEWLNEHEQTDLLHVIELRIYEKKNLRNWLLDLWRRFFKWIT